MNVLNIPVVNKAANASTNFTAIDTRDTFAASFMGTFTDGTAAGTLAVQASNDEVNAGNLATNWLLIPSASVIIAAGASNWIPMPLTFSYRWLRIVWTRTAGAGTLTVNMNSQSY